MAISINTKASNLGKPTDAPDARLIEKHGYWRRKEELEDAEAVIGR